MSFTLTGKMKVMKSSLRFSVLAVLCCALSGCGRTSKVTREDSDSFRRHTFWSDKKTVFSSTVSVLNDMHYVASTMDYEGGLIVAEKQMEDGHKRANGGAVSAFVEEFESEGTSVCLNFTAEKGSGRSAKKVLVSDQGLYKEVFDKIEQKVRNRQQIQLYQLQQNKN